MNKGKREPGRSYKPLHFTVSITFCASGKNTVNRLEKNHTEPHMTTIRKLADALGVDPRELIDDA